MLTGFEKIVEERILKAQRDGEFDNLEHSGKPLDLSDNDCVPEELRIAYKILKNANCLPPEIELAKEIKQTEDLLANIQDEKEKYKAIKKANFLIMKLNITRNISIVSEMPQIYSDKIINLCQSSQSKKK